MEMQSTVWVCIARTHESSRHSLVAWVGHCWEPPGGGGGEKCVMRPRDSDQTQLRRPGARRATSALQLSPWAVLCRRRLSRPPLWIKIAQKHTHTHTHRHTWRYSALGCARTVQLRGAAGRRSSEKFTKKKLHECNRGCWTPSWDRRRERMHSFIFCGFGLILRLLNLTTHHLRYLFCLDRR